MTGGNEPNTPKGHHRIAAEGDADEADVLVGISPATYSEIESLARATGVGARRMLDRLIEHGVNSWHEARQAGRLTSLW
jgi:hypothetical protein